MDTEERGASLRRALALVAALGDPDLVAAGGAGVSQLATMTGQDKSQVSRTLRTLADVGMVDRDPTTQLYRIGWQLYVLAARAGDQRLLALARPLLLQVVAETGERSHLSVLRGSGVLTVLTESPSRALQTVSWVGRVVPCHVSSSGRALLLDHDRAQLVTLLGDAPLEQFAPHGPADVEQLAARLDVARGTGWVCVDEEFEPGVMAVAAPVRDATGRIVAALNVSAPRFRLADRLGGASATITRAAAELSQQLGWAPTSHDRSLVSS